VLTAQKTAIRHWPVESIAGVHFTSIRLEESSIAHGFHSLPFAADQDQVAVLERIEQTYLRICDEIS
jgi:hypothetical protein